MTAPLYLRGAELDPSGTYRYRLWRGWDAAEPTVAFVMLNPSTADAEREDPTIRRCLNFARAWGYGRLEVVNLFAWRATDPRALVTAPEPIGPGNDAAIAAVADASETIVLAWGFMAQRVRQRGRDRAVLDLLRPWRLRLHYLGWCKNAPDPRHPLMLRADQPLNRWPGGPDLRLVERADG